ASFSVFRVRVSYPTETCTTSNTSLPTWYRTMRLTCPGGWRAVNRRVPSCRRGQVKLLVRPPASTVTVVDRRPDRVADVFLVKDLVASMDCELALALSVPVADEVLVLRVAVTVVDRRPDRVADVFLVKDFVASTDGEGSLADSAETAS